jgi:HEAT repeat protein
VTVLGPARAVKKRDVRLQNAPVGPESLDDWHWKARRVLSRFGSRTVPALVEALAGGDEPAIRLFAAESLALLGPDAREASDALRRAAGHDEDPLVRAAAATALGAVEATGAS